MATHEAYVDDFYIKKQWLIKANTKKIEDCYDIDFNKVSKFILTQKIRFLVPDHTEMYSKERKRTPRL